MLTTLATTITYILVATGVVGSDKAGDVGELMLQAITGIVALGTIISLHLSRTEIKKKQMDIAGPQVG
jgi:hypothetical protein